MTTIHKALEQALDALKDLRSIVDQRNSGRISDGTLAAWVDLHFYEEGDQPRKGSAKAAITEGRKALAEQAPSTAVEPTHQGKNYEQQVRSQMDAVGGQQPMEGAGSGGNSNPAVLVSNIEALLALDAAGALVPHGIGGHARSLLKSAAALLQSPALPVGEHVNCACGDFYPEDSFSAGFIAAAGHCENCAAAASSQPASEQASVQGDQKLSTIADITIDDDDALKLIRDMVTHEDGDMLPIRLLLGDGHSGHGLYIASADYPEEGAHLLAETPPLAAAPEVKP